MLLMRCIKKKLCRTGLLWMPAKLLSCAGGCFWEKTLVFSTSWICCQLQLCKYSSAVYLAFLVKVLGSCFLFVRVIDSLGLCFGV